MQVTIDPHSGFCFGVVYAIGVAERELHKNPLLYCLGDLVHNNMEVERLKKAGLVIISREDLYELYDCKVLIRAHGEPPETYKIALQNRIELIDASCPIVLNLQNAIRRAYLEMLQRDGQVVIYGKEGHAEVKALIGQTQETAVVIGNEDDLVKIDFSRPVRFYSQTTKSVDGFHKMVKMIGDRMEAVSMGKPVDFEWNDTVCRQVSNRSAKIREFAEEYDVVVFVSDQKSSNGMVLFQECKNINPLTKLVSGFSEVERAWFDNARTVGICGATSTPFWLMEEIANGIRKIND